jgi:hypothetical protein
MFCVLGRRLFWRDPKPVRAAVMLGAPRTGLRPWGGKPKQNTRSPQGGG